MFGFLAAFGPIGITAAVVGTVGAVVYNYMKDDEGESVDTKQNAITNHRYKKNTSMQQGIENFKQMEKKRIKNKYSIDIEFVTNDQKKQTKFGIIQAVLKDKPIQTSVVTTSYIVQMVLSKNNKNKIIILDNTSDENFDFMTKLESEITELDNLVNKLKEFKNESNI